MSERAATREGRCLYPKRRAREKGIIPMPNNETPDRTRPPHALIVLISEVEENIRWLVDVTRHVDHNGSKMIEERGSRVLGDLRTLGAIQKQFEAMVRHIRTLHAMDPSATGASPEPPAVPGSTQNGASQATTTPRRDRKERRSRNNDASKPKGDPQPTQRRWRPLDLTEDRKREMLLDLLRASKSEDPAALPVALEQYMAMYRLTPNQFRGYLASLKNVTHAQLFAVKTLLPKVADERESLAKFLADSLPLGGLSAKDLLQKVAQLDGEHA